jgi:hypothetical protein
MVITNMRRRFCLASSLPVLAFASPSALAHNTEGIGAAILGMIGWPVFVVSIAVVAVSGRKLVSILVAILIYPFIIFNANQMAQYLSPDSWGTEYLLTIIGSGLLCLATFGCVILQAKYPVKCALLARVLAALTIVLLNVTLLGFFPGSIVSEHGLMFAAIAGARNIVLVVSGLLLAEACWREKRTNWATAFLVGIVLLVVALLPKFSSVRFNPMIGMFMNRSIVLCWLNLYLLYFGFYLSSLTHCSSRPASATLQRSA